MESIIIQKESYQEAFVYRLSHFTQNMTHCRIVIVAILIHKIFSSIVLSTSQSQLGKFLIGFQLQTFFENESIYSNLSTIGSHVALDLKYDTSSSDNIVDVYSFYHNILRLDPVTRMYSIASQ